MTAWIERAGQLAQGPWADALYVFPVVLAVLVCNVVLRRVLEHYARHAGTPGLDWQAACLEAINPPLRGVIWVIGLTIAVEILTRGEDLSLLSKLFPPARDLAAIALVAWALLRMTSMVEHGVLARARAEGRTVDPTAADAIGKLVRAAILITAVLVSMQALGFSIAGLVALGGVGGIAIGFAAQSLVANLLGGLTIYASRPFKVGEWIIMPGTEIMGEVQDIGWRATRVMGFDRRPFYVPNAMFNTATVINHSRMTNRRIMEHLHLRYSDIDKVQAIVTDVNVMLAEHPGIEHDFFVFNFDTCGDFAIKCLLYAFTRSTDYSEYMKVKEDILLKIAAIVRKHEAELAVPVSTVHVPDGLRLQPPIRPEAWALAGMSERASRS